MTPEEAKELLLYNRSIEWAEKFEEFTDESVLLMQKSVNRAIDEVTNDLATKKMTEWNVNRSHQMLDAFSEMSEGIKKTMGSSILGMSVEGGLAAYSTHKAIVSFDGKVPGFNNIEVTSAQLRSAIIDTPVGGKKLSKWIDDTFAGKQAMLKEQLTTSMIKGETHKQITDRIKQTLSGISDTEAATLARTYTQSVNVGAMKDVYAQNKNIVKQVEWVATLEVRTSSGRGTCLSCAALDGQRFPQNEHPPCPQHPRCRCILSPITVPWEELGLDYKEMEDEYRPYMRTNDKVGKAYSGGTTPEKTFEDWLKKQGKPYQLNVLGKSRYDLWKNKNHRLIDFIDQEGNVIRLDKLGKKKSFKSFS